MPLSAFHVLTRRWFEQQLGTPTEAQQLAWPRIARGEHVVLAAPTGSGKTLAAFLWALDGLITGRTPPGQVRVLYVSPMRALNNDVRRNLFEPLDGLQREFERAAIPASSVHVMTRSGDTPPEERQRMARRPPEILITTPESLNILLTSQRGRAMLTGLRTVILDEIHAVMGTKRGAHLITAVERLVRLSGEFQRIALSATVTPLERVAQWVGGYQLRGTADSSAYERRPVSVLRSDGSKHYALQVSFPAAQAGTPSQHGDPPDAWPHVVRLLRNTLAANRSTLVFANSKRMVEKLAQMLNAGEREQLAFSHHGALSRELRAVVEERLKQGLVRGIVATNSLELGIDVGLLDQVVIVQTPPSIASTVQRVGRAGHGVGQVSRGLFVPLIARDVLNATVVSRAVLDGAIEPVRPVLGALDVLAQVLVSMSASESWQIDALHAFLRTAEPYHGLSRRQLDLVLEMLAGRYASTRIRELKPLIAIDRVRGVVRARPGAARLVYMAGGTIPDRGYFRLRRAESMALIGELDEEFVWERSIGDTFTLGVQSWRIAQITHHDVLVTPANKGTAMAPFWRAESRDRSFELSERVGALLEHIDERWGETAWRDTLRGEHKLDADATEALVGLLARQRGALANVLPHRHRVVLENVVEPLSQGARGMVVLHTLWGGRVNQPLAMALQAAWQQRTGHAIEVMHDDDCVVLDTTEPLRAEDVFALVPIERLEDLLRARLA
ncbi:MAG: DEAD/DEAH box helicase, partial [Polyangiaceae bacterium]|nr:DEAD/DEAH box helicase [Polyangiaceae bacterium]